MRPHRAVGARRSWLETLVPVLCAGLCVSGASGSTARAAEAERNAGASRSAGAEVLVSAAGAPAERGDPRDELDIATLRDRGGVLTPPGVLTLEPELELVSSSDLRFEFDGLSVQEAFLIGEIQASGLERSGVVARLQARLGLSDRLEASVEIPWVWRSDRFDRQIATESDPNGLSQRTSGQGLGDLSLGLTYEFARDPGDRLAMIGSVRVRTATGSSPFEVDRDASGFETELATGAGFWSVESSVTWIYPSDPAVLYGGLSYTWNQTARPDASRRIGGTDVRIEAIDPGDSIGTSFGVGIALNETTSLSLGYSHQYILRSETEIEDTTFFSRSLHVGELQLGVSFEAFGTPLRLTTAIGVTDNAPDARISISMPVGWRVFGSDEP